MSDNEHNACDYTSDVLGEVIEMLEAAKAKGNFDEDTIEHAQACVSAVAISRGIW